MTGKWLAPWLPILWSGSGLPRSFGGRFVALDIIQSKRELVVIDTLGSPSELRALQLANDQAKTLDLTVIMLAAAEKAGGLHRRSGRSAQSRAFGRGRAASIATARLMTDRTRSLTVKARVMRHKARGAPVPPANLTQ